ncbi:MAG: chemotaxis protein CheD [Pseudomonadota bacterium]
MSSPVDMQTDIGEAYLMPGAVHVSSVPVRCTTILGSCVALCLFDVAAGVGGLNHFLLPGAAPARDPEPLRWSDDACDFLYERVIAAGASACRLQVKVFGGAAVGMPVNAGSLRIGERNVEAVLSMLQRRRLPAPLASDVGGAAGRKLVFEAHTGRAWVKVLVQGTG